MRIKYLSLALVASLLSACGSSSEHTGHLLDAAVSGASYHGSLQSSGVTGANGEFSFHPTEIITFTIGGITLGSAQGGGTVLLNQLDGGLDENGQPSRISVNRAIFLQSIDTDGDASNGIQISNATVDALKSASLNFDQDSSSFSTVLASLLETEPVAAQDALDHLLVTEAETKGNVKVVVGDGIIDSVQRFVVPDNRVAYPGSDAGLKAIFPNGFPLAVGSGLAFDSSTNGTLTFYGITDRGPNADSPILLSDMKTATKVFPVPNFAPTIVKLTVDTVGNKGVVVSDAHELNRNGSKISGRPVEAGTGSSGEVALDETLTHKLAFDPEGMDTEALVKDPQDSSYAWTCDEYGPFVAKIKLATGEIVRKYSPGVELPAVIAKRQPNRGCEGLAITPSGKLYAMVQSTLDVPDANNKSVKDKALFTRIVEIDRSNEASPTTKTFAYPLNPADWQDGKSGKAKLGDLVAVDDTHFLIMEQGAFSDNKIHNKIFLVDISGATDISNIKNGSLELETVTTASGLMAAGVTRARKTLIGDMRDYGWILEKAEGLALVDNKTIALTNDDDFGLGTDTHDTNGVEADPTKLYVDTSTGAVSDGGSKSYSYKVTGNDPSQRRTQLWLIKLAKPVLDFQQNYSFAQAGDLLQAPLKDFHPTQPAIGYDQIYYKLGRYAKNLDTPNKKYDDYCEDMGANAATKATVTNSSTLGDGSSFSCKDPIGKTLTSMKSAVIGPQGKLYLTDGHHSFTSYWETPDGGQNMKVWVRVLANFSTAKSMTEFWDLMKANRYVWLKDGGNGDAEITTDQLPAQLGLASFHNDPYRSLIYFTRDIGYSQPSGATEFLEFYWGEWMRSDASGLGNITAQMTDFNTYLNAVSTAANAMVALPAGSVVNGGKTTVDLGKLDAFGSSEFTKLSKPINDAKPGKLAYALDYKSNLPAP